MLYNTIVFASPTTLKVFCVFVLVPISTTITTTLFLHLFYVYKQIMSRVVPQGPWITKLDWDLYATHDGEIHVPFRHHVQPRDMHQPTKNFRRFLQLPTELQIAIFSHCDSAVLFQLMHVSSRTRKEAKKLFWSCPDAWFQIDGRWLLAGGFSGHTYNDLDFLACARQIEVDFNGCGPLTHNAWEDGIQQYAKRPPDHIRDQQIYRFWQTLQWRFPCATDVVLSGLSGEDAGVAPPADYMTVAEKCPSRIRASVSCRQRVAGHPSRATRTLWRLSYPSYGQSQAWEVATLYWTRQCVLPPPKTFRGPVGAFCRIQYHSSHYFYRHFAIRALSIQAIKAYYLQDSQKPCVCPISGCGLQFELPGQWAAHAIDTGHYNNITFPSRQLQTSFKDHSARIESLEQKYADAMAELQIAWGKEGSNQRANAEQAFLSQLQHDPLYMHEKPPEESFMWLDYKEKMNKHAELELES
ncbi:hypothetical protein BKA58DRAFT_380191 [Alternaria rosae]|uniref:uncharacterized protein n=1 Tax=Alternaria rosae TaxID=1187941 RepID=UPI001E8D9970|nr:uncharacterized protein BKA58DRAFT_380191 [Alternaria rosae]KAH6875637.1 hypothetical protein BKA58DRAFT_380191 [Alternaria rosae]